MFNISTDTVVGSAKDARAKTGFLKDLGFTNSNRILSDVKLLDYKPKNTLHQGISKVIEWMKKPDNLVKYKSGRYNV